MEIPQQNHIKETTLKTWLGRNKLLYIYINIIVIMSYCLSLKKFAAKNISFKMSAPPSARVQAHVEMKVYIWATSAILKQKETAYLQVKKQQYSN